jgi:hypothetical protein
MFRRLKSVDINKRLSAKPESKPEKEAPLIAAPPPPGLHNKLDRILNVSLTFVIYSDPSVLFVSWIRVEVKGLHFCLH